MKAPFKTFRAWLVIAALVPFSSGALLADDAKQPAPTKAPETPVHEIGAAPDAPTAPAAPAVPTPTPTAEPARQWHVNGDRNDDNRFALGDSVYVGQSENIVGNAVAVSGSVTVDGNVDGNAVAVIGETTINGTVHGNAVAVLGSLKLGPNARVDGNAVSVGGRVTKDPSAIVVGNTVPINMGLDFSENEAATSYWKHGLKLGRPVAFGPHLFAFWTLNICLAAFYILLAILFPKGIAKCADTLVERPGITLLTGFLAFLGMPVLFILLLVTVVGIPVAFLVLPVSVLACVVFGRVAVYSLIGRTIVGKNASAALSAAVGIAAALALYFVPVLGIALWMLIAFIGFACALTALFTSGQRQAPAGAAPGAGTPPLAAPSVPPVQAAAAAAAASAVVSGPPPVAPPAAQAPALEPGAQAPAAPAPAAALPPAPSVVSEAALPRAGFWVRMAALLIDFILIAIVFHAPILFLPALAAYGAVLWKLKGATIGGIIFGLKVVRADDRPTDWATACVRSLACFLSMVALGLGFIWIAFDPEKQAWHDKIAGTVVVRAPKGVSLV